MEFKKFQRIEKNTKNIKEIQGECKKRQGNSKKFRVRIQGIERIQNFLIIQKMQTLLIYIYTFTY